jgi:hypothetical protein
MLNNEGNRSPRPSASVTAGNVSPRPPPIKSEAATTSTPNPLDGQSQDPMSKDDSEQPRKRQRVEDYPSPKTGSQPPLAPNADGAGSLVAGVSQEQSARVLNTQSPSRNKSVVHPGDSEREMEPSITNSHLIDELTRLISDFIFLNLNDEGLDNLEARTLK